MAKRTFKCPKCERVHQTVGPRSLSVVCPECGADMIQQMPQTSKPTAYESSDKSANRQWLDDHASILKNRKETHFWSVEVPRMVASGVYSIETMLQNGWIWIDDAGKMNVHTKPPSQR